MTLFGIHKEAKMTFFKITSVCREDFEDVGYDATKLDDSQMVEVAEKISEALTGSLYWEVLRTIAREWQLPRKPRSLSQSRRIKAQKGG